MEYEEHVGVKRHARGRRGERKDLYHSTRDMNGLESREEESREEESREEESREEEEGNGGGVDTTPSIPSIPSKPSPPPLLLRGGEYHRPYIRSSPRVKSAAVVASGVVHRPADATAAADEFTTGWNGDGRY